MSVSVPLFDISRANDRVVRITNVHYEATADEISQFLKDFVILDQYRTINPRTRTKSVVYVLFASARDKNASRNLKGQLLRGRRVDIMPAPSGNYRINENNTKFIQDEASPVLATPAATFAMPLFNSVNFPALGGGLGLKNYKLSSYEDGIGRGNTSRPSETGALCGSWTPEENASHLAEPSSAEDDKIPSSIDERELSKNVEEVSAKVSSKTIVWGVTSEELAQVHSSTYVNLKPMPSGFEIPRQIVTIGTLPYSKEYVDSISTAREEHCLPGLQECRDPKEQPVRLDRSASTDKSWNCFGTEDGVLTEDQWYNFDASQARKDF